jgi:hypothetical protein
MPFGKCKVSQPLDLLFLSLERTLFCFSFMRTTGHPSMAAAIGNEITNVHSYILLIVIGGKLATPKYVPSDIVNRDYPRFTRHV